MRRGDIDTAVRMVQKLYAAKSNNSLAMELGVTHLWLQRYEEARDHFDGFNSKYPNYGSNFYCMAGVARWCLGEYEGAVEQWRIALNCGYADIGQFQAPLLLFAASVLTPPLFPRSEAETLLGDRASRPGNWPWPKGLAEFLLGRINENQLLDCCSNPRPSAGEMEKGRNRWVSGFYVGILESAQENPAGFLDRMRAVSNVSWDDFDSDYRDFLRKLWHEEFFIARHLSYLAACAGEKA